MNVMEEITKAVDILNRVDDYDKTLWDELSELDCKEQDILHYIENNPINMLRCYNIIKHIKTIRLKRRKVKNDRELLSRFNDIKAKITSRDNRQFILTELHKKEKALDTTYKNRQYSEEDIQKILKGIYKEDSYEESIPESKNAD